MFIVWVKKRTPFVEVIWWHTKLIEELIFRVGWTKKGAMHFVKQNSKKFSDNKLKDDWWVCGFSVV